jgi:hypothetical protein
MKFGELVELKKKLVSDDEKEFMKAAMTLRMEYDLDNEDLFMVITGRDTVEEIIERRRER